MKKVVLFAAAMLLMAFQANAQLTADAGSIHGWEKAKVTYTLPVSKDEVTE